MKKIIITLAAALALTLSSMLASCTGNTMSDGNTTDNPSSSTTEGTNIIDGAESKLEDMSEDATHGVESNAGEVTPNTVPRGK